MLKELLSFIYEKAEDRAHNQSARALAFLSDDDVVVFEHNGEIKERAIAPKTRTHVVESIPGLVEAAKKWGTGGTIWINDNSITLLCDDDHRRDLVSLPLHPTDVFQVAQKLASAPVVDQPTLIKLLRREFRNSPQAAKLLGSVRKLRFNRNEAGFSNIQHGNESMGRTVEAAVVGVDEPFIEELMLPMVVYKNAGEAVNVGFSFDVDMSNHKFSVKPLPDELHFAVQQVLTGIRSDILQGVGKDFPVFFGSP